MTKQISPSAAYVQSINAHNRAAFNGLFATGAIVNDVGREYRGPAAIKAWSDREVFDAQVTLEVLDVADHDGETVITTQVEGNSHDYHVRTRSENVARRTNPAPDCPLARLRRQIHRTGPCAL